MAAVFHEVASIDYPIIDADAHVYEPPDVWQARVASAAARARAEGGRARTRATCGRSTTARACGRSA